MKKLDKSVGKVKKRNKEILTRANEFGEKASDHFSTMFIQRLKNVREVRLWVVEWALLILVVLLLAIVQIFWYDSSYKTQAFVAGGEFTEASLGDVKSMNPLYATTNSEKALARLLFANLASPDKSGHMKMELAESATMSKDGKTWTVTLRDGLKWSDGEPITADDILYTVKLMNDETAKTTVAIDFSRIKLQKVDERSVSFTLPTAYTDFTDSLEFPLIPAHILGEVSPALVYEHDFSSNPVGSGAFALKAVQPGGGNNRFLQTIYMKRNENFFGNESKLASFNLRSYEKVEDIASAMKEATVTATAEEVELSDTKGVNRRTSLLSGGAFAFLNTKSPVLKSSAVRRGIQQGVDMSAVRAEIDEMRWLDYPILETQEANLEYPELAKYDLEAAKKLLVDGGLKYNEEGRLCDEAGSLAELRLAVRKRQPIQSVAERFKEELQQLGFTVSLSVFDDTQPNMDFFASVLRPRDYDVLFYEIDLGVSADPFVYYSSSQASGGGWNFSNYSNALADDALLTARTSLDASLRETKYNSFLQRWVNDVPAIGLYQSAMNYYYQDGVRIFSDDALLTDVWDRFGDVEYWASLQEARMQTP